MSLLENTGQSSAWTVEDFRFDAHLGFATTSGESWMSSAQSSTQLRNLLCWTSKVNRAQVNLLSGHKL
ncbi:hypothetical protein N9P82_00295 [bacterium]|nr:hypothetical protein [bacterium]